MSATNAQKPEFTRDDVIDLLAVVRAARSLITHDLGEDFSHDNVSSESLADGVAVVEQRLKDRLLGPELPGDEEYATDPTEVEILAREAEFEAEMIEVAYSSSVRHAELMAKNNAERFGRSAQLKVMATEERRAKSVNVAMPSSSEMSERLRVKMNAEAVAS